MKALLEALKAIDENRCIKDINTKQVKSEFTGATITEVEVEYNYGTRVSSKSITGVLHPEFEKFLYVPSEDSIYELRNGMRIATHYSRNIPLRFAVIGKKKGEPQTFIGVDKFVADIYHDCTKLWRDVSRHNDRVKELGFKDKDGKRLSKQEIYISHINGDHSSCKPENLKPMKVCEREARRLKLSWNIFKEKYSPHINTLFNMYNINGELVATRSALELSHSFSLPVEHFHFFAKHGSTLDRYNIVRRLMEVFKFKYKYKESELAIDSHPEHIEELDPKYDICSCTES